MDRNLSVYKNEDTEFDCHKTFLSHRLTKVLTSRNAFSTTKTVEIIRKKTKKMYKIEDVYGQEKEQEIDEVEQRKKMFLDTIKDESKLWHNNIRLPYQKKVKKD